MKKLIVSLGVFSFALFFVLISCEIKKPEGATSSLASVPAKEVKAPTPAPPSPGKPQFISGSDLAYGSYLMDGKAKLDVVKSMYKVVEEEKMKIASYQPDVANNDCQRLTSLAAKEVCECPGGGGVCPCHSDTTASIAMSDANAKVFYGATEMKPKKILGTAKPDFKVFKWPTTMAEGPDTLIIVRKFGGRDAAKYRVPVVFKGGKLFFMWPK